MKRQPTGKASPKRKRPAGRTRKLRSNWTKAVLYTIGFVVLVSALIFALHFVKKDKNTENIFTSSTEVNSVIEDIDNKLLELFFDVGITKRDIVKDVYDHRSKGETNWKHRTLEIKVPGRVSKSIIRNNIKNHFSDIEINKDITFKNNDITTNIGVGDISTHKLIFKFEKLITAKIKSTQIDNNQSITKGNADLQKHLKHKKYSEKISANGKPKIAIIIDDIGLDKNQIDRLLNISVPLNFAILPDLPYSNYAAKMANDKGWEVILHLPMEPKETSGYFAEDAGENALLVGLPKSEILDRLKHNLSSVPYVKGVNNHMGSKFTENEELMELVLKELKEEGLFYIDSKTTVNTVGFKLGRKMGLKTGSRDIFLDKSQRDPKYIKSRLDELVRVSKLSGSAIGICHPYPETIEVLRNNLPNIDKEVDIALVSNLL